MKPLLCAEGKALSAAEPYLCGCWESVLVTSLGCAGFGEVQIPVCQIQFVLGSKAEGLPWDLRLFWSMFLHHKHCIVIVTPRLLG